LDAVIAGIGNIEIAVRPESQGTDARELARFGPRSAPTTHEFPIAIEFADAFIFAEFGDIIEAILVLNRIADIAELPRPGALVSTKGSQQFAFRRIDAQARIMGIADQEIAVPVDAQPAGPAIAVIGCGPDMVQEIAVAIENLNARCPIDE